MLKFHHFILIVDDMKRSLHFYCDLLGFQEVERYSWEKREPIANETDAAGEGVIIGSGNAFIELNTYNYPLQRDQNDNFHFGIITDNNDNLIKKLKIKGVKIVKEPYDTGMGTTLSFVKDPDGYLIEILEVHDSDDRLNINFNS